MKRNSMACLIFLVFSFVQTQGASLARNQLPRALNNKKKSNAFGEKILKNFGIDLELPSNKLISMHSSHSIFKPLPSIQIGKLSNKTSTTNQLRKSFDIQTNLQQIKDLKAKKALKIKQHLTERMDIFQTMQQSAKLVGKQLHFLSSIVNNLTGVDLNGVTGGNELNSEETNTQSKLLIQDLKTLTKNLNDLIEKLKLIKDLD